MAKPLLAFSSSNSRRLISVLILVPNSGRPQGGCGRHRGLAPSVRADRVWRDAAQLKARPRRSVKMKAPAEFNQPGTGATDTAAGRHQRNTLHCSRAVLE